MLPCAWDLSKLANGTDTKANAIAGKHRSFTGAQEMIRIEVKRDFGAQISRWRIPAKLCDF